MTVTVETLDKLERKITLNLPAKTIASEVDARLRKAARTIRMDGFRPGKVPVSAINPHYAQTIYQEVMQNHLEQAFHTATQQAQLRIAGMPSISQAEAASNDVMAFDAVFEVYPEVQLPDLGTLEVTKFEASVSEAAIDSTIELLRKQRRSFTPRPEGEGAQNGDQVTVDFEGKIDGEAFAGGKANDFQFILGELQMLKEFESATLGMKAGESKTFPLLFPSDYHGKEVAGKTADFMLSVKRIEAGHLPEVDDAMVQALGIPNGSVEGLRADIRKNLEIEVRSRLVARNKQGVFAALLANTTLDVPKSSVQVQMEHLTEKARADLKARGVPDVDQQKLPEDLFRPEAERRVRLGFIAAELLRHHALLPSPEQVTAYIQTIATSYENPAEVAQWYQKDKEKMTEVEQMLTESNIVDLVLSQAKVTVQTLSFEELMR